jgi:hypothetical protein
LGSVLKGLNHVDFAVHTAIIQIALINEEKMLGYDVNVLARSTYTEQWKNYQTLRVWF